jgi:methyl-accepting chemotaxis protein
LGFLDHLPLRAKFVLLALAALVLVAVPTVFQVRQELAAWRMADAELRGVPPAHALLTASRLVQQHRGLSTRLLQGDAGAAEPRRAAADAATQALSAAQAALRAAGQEALADAAGEQATGFAALAQEVAAGRVAAADSFERHSRREHALLGLVQDVANASGIVLHPEPAGYFLQLAVLTELPRLGEQFGQLRAAGWLVLAGQDPAANRQRLRQIQARAGAYDEAAQRSLVLAAKESPTLMQPVQAALASAAAVREEVQQALARSVLPETGVPLAPADWWALGSRLVDAEFEVTTRALQALSAELEATRTAALRRLGLLAALLAGLGALAGLLAVRIASRTIRTFGLAVALAEAVRAGDLTRSVEDDGARDEGGRLLRALEAMRADLGRLVTGVRQNAESVASASGQIAQGNTDLSSRTEEQASALQQTAASMKQLAGTVEQNAASARQGNALAREATQVAGRGGEVVGQVVATMRGIEDSSRRITEIIATIDGIAFQTNILALNAAVEAARAGEQGRGFAVVAGEVRTLAQRAAVAAREIRDLISASAERVEAGTALVGQAGATMQDVTAAIGRVEQLMGRIAQASDEQNTGVAQVGEAVGQMDQATQQNAALVEQSAAAADSLRHQAQQLLEMVRRFRLAPA